MPADLTRRIWSLVEAGQVNDKVIAALEANSPLGKILATGLQHRHRPREVMMERLEDAGRHVAHELDRFLNTLGTIAGVAPLLGLLGTVTGIIKAFNVIYSGGLGDPRALSGGISEALLTTAFGLMVAIPSFVAYRYLRGRVDSTVVQIERDVVRFADALNDRMDSGAERERA
jgi:biopolymer transport protein ExbB